MYTEDRSRRRREVITTAALTILSGIAFFAVCWILTGWIVAGVVVALAVMAIVGGFHYALWGRELAREVRRRDANPPPPPRPLM